MTGEEESDGWQDLQVRGWRESNGADKVHKHEEREKAMVLTRSTSNRSTERGASAFQLVEAKMFLHG